MTDNKVPKLWILFFLLIVFLVIGLFATAPKVSDSLDDQSAEMETTDDTITRSQTFEQMLALGEDAVYLENQQSGEREVIVGYAVLSEPGFVVIYNDNDGIPGDAIGDSGWMEEGGEHVSVRLEEPLEEKGVYYAVLFNDDGDGEFTEVHDTQVVDSEGSVVLMTFEALEGANPETEPIQS
jgi:hypothetical protein